MKGTITILAILGIVSTGCVKPSNRDVFNPKSHERSMRKTMKQDAKAHFGKDSKCNTCPDPDKTKQ